ncbi:MULTISPECIES: competence type IV pilus ATPase ComGA [Vagococcus]|uniref:Late competence protein ComGA, access of DNA to ComEA n=1 Tax=Vagococcus fluvialis bH819 TaxID=1255619 RepID=A0A1X6WPF3_9ENTE|nr:MULTISPECIES: competence type IV pilus ATPase ComGA [Vagococcus]SLM85546.1 Late competence protein ComGA, access of DNA to ComEA [Vagococcus fluvialis bH819]HCM89513.1 secretion system protein E [Vagococcus sp.]
MSVKQRARYLLKKGFKLNASDLYIFPSQEQYELSFRYHHEMTHFQEISLEEGEKLILYLKYLAGMDVSEKRKTQVGSASISIKEKSHRIRLSSVADFKNRETLVIRFLQNKQELSQLNFVFPEQLKLLESLICLPGLYLFSGPTGAGKSTSMYYLANYLNKQKEKQIITIEDPVEIENNDFLQFQVNEKIDLTYQELIKVCLRHRPDILIIGEIRDHETAKMVIRAALTGHMVFSTIHSQDKEGVLIRLKDLGIPEVEVQQSLRGVVYQELIPVLRKSKYEVMYDLSINGVVTNWKEDLHQAYQESVISEETYRLSKREF